mgnify:CR=1 FL=1
MDQLAEFAIQTALQVHDEDYLRGLIWDTNEVTWRVTADADPSWRQDDLAGTYTGTNGHRYIDDDAVSEALQDARVHWLVETLGLDRTEAERWRFGYLRNP